jgi:hypothetical protein
MGLTDPVIAALRGLDPADLPQLIRELASRVGPERLRAAMAEVQHDADDLDPFSGGLICAADMPDARAPTPLWFGVYPAAVTLFVGETGAGKSSMLYNLAIHAARNAELFGIGFGLGRPVRVMVVDPENAGSYRATPVSGGLCAARLERINAGRPCDLWFHDGQNVNLSLAAHLVALEELVRAKQFDLVILDTISVLFRTDDENDNTEAVRQMNSLRDLARSTAAAIVAVHHTGKAAANATGMAAHYGRGASARLALADVGMILRARAPSDDDDTYGRCARPRTDVCQLHIAKDRCGAFGTTSLYIRMAGLDRFETVPIGEWRSARGGSSAASPSRSDRVEALILDALSTRKSMKRQEIVGMAMAESISIRTTDKVLKALVGANQISVTTGCRGARIYSKRQDPGA